MVAAPKSATFDVDKPPLLNTLGLYQGDYVEAGADIGYQRLLDHALLPRVAKRLEERLRAVNRDNLELAYEALKGYLMLYTPEHFDAEQLKAWVTLDWEMNLAGTLNPQQREGARCAPRRGAGEGRRRGRSRRWTRSWSPTCATC